MPRRVVARANFTGFAVLIGLLALVGAFTWDRFREAATARAWTRHTYDVLAAIKDLDLAAHDAETGQRGFLLTGDETYLAPYNGALGRITTLFSRLHDLTTDNPIQQKRLDLVAPLLARKLEELAQTIQLRRTDGLPAALQVVATGRGQHLRLSIDGLLGAMTADEQSLLVKREALATTRDTWVLRLMIGSFFVGVALLVGAAATLNRAWARAMRSENEQRGLALRLRTSLDSLSQGIGVFDAGRGLLNWNPCFQVLLEIPPAMLRVAAPYEGFYEYTLTRGDLLESPEQVLHGQHKPGEPVVYERERSDTHILELRRTVMPGGGFVLTVTDHTDRARADAVLREAQKMQAIGHLTGGIAHDFNNLLTVILGNLEMVRDKPADETARQTRIGRAMWAARRGAALTRQLLAFARKQPLAPTAIDLAATMPELISLLTRTLGETIEVRYVETSGLWPAMADPSQLESAVLNLALNARDAMPGGGRLTIELANRVLDEAYAARHAEVEAGDYSMLAVSDTGTGMPAEILARVFEPFFTTKAAGAGTGLGLAMVFGFVKQSGGHIKIYSEPGQGTTVRIYLPRAILATEPVLSPPSHAPVSLPRGSGTILVVEDEAAVREVATAILRDLGYQVLEAADGEEALRVFGTHVTKISLLLTDVVLPGPLRGRDVAERIVAIRPEIRVLYMSGYTENSIVHHGRLDDGVKLISKPFAREELAARVAELLEQTSTVTRFRKPGM